MNLLRNLVVICAATILAGSALAQGGGRQGFGMMMGGQGDSSGVGLLFGGRNQPARKDVQTDLNLTDDEKSKIAAIQAKMRDDMREIFQNSGNDREAAMQAMQKYQEKMRKDVLAVLTKEQVTRLREINIQLSGNMAATWPDVQEKLGFTADQKAKVKDLQTKQMDAMRALGQKRQDQEITNEEFQDAMKKNNDILKAELGKILTSDQQTTLKTMGGKEFKADKAG